MNTEVVFCNEGRVEDLDGDARARLLDRSFEPDAAVVAVVSDVVREVATAGDDALRSMAERFDNVVLDDIEVPRKTWKEALDRIPGELAASLRTARDRIAAFHRTQLPSSEEFDAGAGIRLGRRPEPLRVVGAYAPGGRAAYPSSVLMCVVPARLAGVERVVVCSPPAADREGAPPDVVLAAAEIAGADAVYAVGGAGAVAALAYGTKSVPRADKVVGPGNAYVTEAKRQLAGRIASDCLAGPSELLVIADGGADPEVIARELIAQAEHDPEAVVVAVTTEDTLAPRVTDALARLIPAQPRESIVREALQSRGALLQATDLEAAITFANDFAAEHLLLLVENPREAMETVRGAGSVFLGPHSSVSFGDYMSGTNHVLPTSGQGRAASGLSVDDFIRWSTYQEITAEGAARLAPDTELLATAEGLPGHAAAARALAGTPATTDRAPSAVQARPGYASLATYDPGRSPVEVDLTDNTNLFGQAPSAVAVLESLDAASARRYPSLYGGELKAAAADYFGVSESNIATGCGSDDLIDSCIRAYCGAHDAIAYARPTFSMIEAFARMNGVETRSIDLDDGFRLDADSLIALGAQVTYLCRPNNPTGNASPRDQVEEVVARASGIVILDEAYGDFSDDPLASWAPSTDRAVVFRTLSKAFGLAGLRVGIAVGPEDVIANIEKSRGPYKVSAVAEAAAAAALRNDGGWVADTVVEARNAREKLASDLGGLGLDVYPSDANFLLVEAPGADAVRFAASLGTRGVGVRPFPTLPHAGDCMRITVGPPPLMDRLMSAIEEFTSS